MMSILSLHEQKFIGTLLICLALYSQTVMHVSGLLSKDIHANTFRLVIGLVSTHNTEKWYTHTHTHTLYLLWLDYIFNMLNILIFMCHLLWLLFYISFLDHFNFWSACMCLHLFKIVLAVLCMDDLAFAVLNCFVFLII